MPSSDRKEYDKVVRKYMSFLPVLDKWCISKKIDMTIYFTLFEEIFAIAEYSDSYLHILNQFFDDLDKDSLYLLLEGKKFYSGQIQEHSQLFEFCR